MTSLSASVDTRNELVRDVLGGMTSFPLAGGRRERIRSQEAGRKWYDDRVPARGPLRPGVEQKENRDDDLIYILVV